MNGIQIFSYRENQVRTVELNGEPWFVLRDVCAVLGITHITDTAKRLDEDEVGLTEVIDSLGRQQETTIINESGLYNVILRSDKPEAKPFRKWVTSEVLPSIRKTGGYDAPQALPVSKELQAIFLLDSRTVQHEQRISALESSMVVDYGQQKTLQKCVNQIVVAALGGSGAPAYCDPHIRGKVYSECNNDLQSWFRVSSRNNIPRKRFEEAVEYISRWKPSTNTAMMIRNANSQTQMFGDCGA